MAAKEDLEFADTLLTLTDFQEGSDLLTIPLDAPDHTEGDGGVALIEDLSEDEVGQEESKLLRDENEPDGLWSFEYYQTFFNVDTEQVLDRVKGSLIPLLGRNFVRHHIHGNPDLYGPLWICVTLAFFLAIGGNLSTFLTQRGDPKYHYKPQFNTVSVAAMSVFLYVLLVPLCVWGFLKWRQRAERHLRSYSYPETLCLCGYSLFIYIPTTVLWILPIEWLRWVSVLVAMAISGLLLAISFWPLIRDDSKAVAAVTVAVILILHALLAIGCELYFFQMAAHTVAPTLAPPSTNNTAQQPIT